MDHATERMIEAYVARDSFEGHFLKDLLSGQGIEAHVTDENSVYAGVGGIERPKVWVFEKDQEAARRLLEEYEATRAQSAAQPDEADDIAPEFDARDETP
ncbi:hypothetical protein Pan44_54610 [Caulifigura coniformis]|uniref:DUF2007 domain-containing protein n=1 Tax=Caulifigura coniformis TaxID=2527983 RepID=A0A517SMN9_9PLAN|nr:DUF2007 domain-containing protein [Caulifigura coniformis]QDT57392.1 hypothetical protein Pan44_54610 [Caulifigura coniformis]